MSTTTSPAATNRVLRWEMLLVMLLSFGESAIRAVVSIIEKQTRPEPIAQQTTRINTSATPDRPWLDLMYQLMNTVFPLMPVALVLYLLWQVRRPDDGPWGCMGFDLKAPGKDLSYGFGIFAVIGIGGLAWYIAAREMGINTQVLPANLAAAWWTIPILVLRAVMNGVVEEVVMIGYLFTRWAQLQRPMWQMLVISAVIRGAYHLYQGYGGFVGNLVMGLIFGWLYLKTKRVMPLVIVHTLLDLFAFIGYPLAAEYLRWL